MNNQPSSAADRGPIAWMVRNRVAANLLMLTFIAGGLLSLRNTTQEVFPDFELDLVRVTVAYPGAGPEEIEQGIILAIEEAVRGLEGVKQVSATAREGAGVVAVELLSGADRQKIYQEIQQEVARITTFPEEAEEPTVVLVARRREVINLALHGYLPETTLRALAEAARERLLREPEISQVELGGIRGLEIEVAIGRNRLREFGLTIPEVASLIRRSALELAGGGLKTPSGEVLVRVQDRRDFGRQFASLPLLGPATGGEVRLGEIASVTDDFEDTDRFAVYDGEPCVLLEVYRIGDQTPISVAAAARRVMGELNAGYPPGVKISVLRDWSDVYRQRRDLLVKNGFYGLVLVLLLLGLFLQPRIAFWVMMGIPISFLGSFLFLPGFDVTINMISMFAFIVSLGIVVDDAIVVGENIHDHRLSGMGHLEAALKGVKEVTTPVVFSILTNIVAFVPLLFMPGTMGKVWRVIPIVVITVFAVSLVECLLILPAHLSHRRRPEGTRPGRLLRRQMAFSSWFYRVVRSRYAPFLERALRFRYLVLALSIALLILTFGYVGGKRIAMILAPRMDSDYSIVTAVLPYGSPVERSVAVRDRLINAARRVADENGGEELIEGIYAEIGKEYGGVSGSHVIEVSATLTPPKVRPLSTAEFTRRWRQATGEIGGLQALVYEADRGGPGSGRSITVELTHADKKILERAGLDLASRLEVFPSVSDIDAGVADGKPQFNFSLLPAGVNLGLNSAEVAGQVRSLFYGTEALRQQRGRNEVKVMVRLPRSERDSEHDIERVLIRTPAGAEVPLSEVVRIDRGRAYTTIERREGRRTITVSANAAPPAESERILGLLTRSILPELVGRYPGLSWSFEGRQADFRESMASLKSGFLFALLGIYVLLAIPLKSYTQPLIVMVSIPFGVIGAVAGHILMGYDLSIMSMMGIIAISGVVINDALILIDFINRERAGGVGVVEAVHGAGIRRFRPILLTTLTTFGGLAPMIFETSRQARFMIPMAISLGYGIIFATAINLVLVPALFLIKEDLSRFLSFCRKTACRCREPGA
jgi:multidrug efflux pump subunit AcrB